MSIKLTPKSKRRTIRREWIKALRSEKYKQGRGYLKIKIHGSEEYTYCPLGVLQDLAEKAGVPDAVDDVNCALTQSVVNWAGLWGELGSASYKTLGTSIVIYNDIVKYSFAKIADILENNPDRYFKEL